MRRKRQRNGEDIPGATANWYTAPVTTSADDGATFRAIASNDSGTVTSVSAQLTVKPVTSGPAIVMPPADQAVVAGQPVSFSVVASSDSPIGYRWQKNGVDLPGETNDTLTFAAASTADSGATIDVIVSDASRSTKSTPVPWRLRLPPALRSFFRSRLAATWSRVIRRHGRSMLGALRR